MKKKLSALLAGIMLFSLMAGCGTTNAGNQSSVGQSSQGNTSGTGEEWTWDRKITLVCPWGVGGGADGTLRPLTSALKEVLGVEVEVVNVEGAGGATGMEYALKQPADGYTYVLGTQSHIMLDLQKILSFDLREEMQPVAKLVHSINIIASSAKAMEGKYSNFTEFCDYAKAHPKELSCSMLTATGSDSVALKQTLAGGLGCDITEVEDYVNIVSYGGGAEQSSAIAGGHVHIMITGADEIKGLIESGDIVPLISMSEERMSLYPDVECTGELGIDSYVGTWRGLMCRVGTPQAAIDSFTAALEEAWNSDSYQEFLANACYLDRPGWATADEFQTLIDEEYVTFEEYLTGAGLI